MPVDTNQNGFGMPNLSWLSVGREGVDILLINTSPFQYTHILRPSVPFIQPDKKISVIHKISC